MSDQADESTAPAHLSRRSLLKGAGYGAAACLSPFAFARGSVAQAGQTGVHGLSIFGSLKYPKDLSHFDYVNPAAPKGGRLSYQPAYWYYNQNTNTFNTLNGYVLKGQAAPRVEYTFDSLLTAAVDEPDSYYGLVADTIDVAADGNSFTFHLRAEPRFHDGSPLTAEDVVFSLKTLQSDGHPSLQDYLKHLASVSAPDPRTVILKFDGKQSRFAPMLAAGQPIFSKAFFDGKDFTASTLDPILGSGPYRVGAFEPGRFLIYDRVADYWAKDLGVNVGHNNFDELRLEFFGDRQVAFEAFKAGGVELRHEYTSSTWVNGYDFPAIKDGRAKKMTFPSEKRPQIYGWFLNMRRPKFADPRTRRAIDHCFDYEWTNANIFYGAYARSVSAFQKSTLMATGMPEGLELELLEEVRDEVPESVFGEAYMPPVSDGSGSDRRLLREANRLLSEAGWQRDGERLVDQTGAPFEIEFLIRTQSFERILGQFIKNLQSLGIQATIRLVEASQYQSRLDIFDFDVASYAVNFSPTPLEGLDGFFGSEAADIEGGSNLAGIKDPAIDRLLERLSAATSRADLEAAARAIDRIIRANQYFIPAWYSSNHRVAVWDKFGWPETKPDYSFPIETTWWAKV